MLASATPCPAQPGDTLLFNGRIQTLDPTGRVVDALAISKGLVSAIGSRAEAEASLPPNARFIDLGGRTVIPGLIDSHIHAIRAGLTFTREVSWIGVNSLQDALSRLTEAAARTPPGDWIIVAGGWNPQQFVERRRPTQAEVTAAAPAHPVYIQLSYAAVLLSPSGFMKLGIAEDMDVPGNGRLDRDEAGRKTGWILGDIDAVVALYGRLPKADLAAAKQGTRAFVRELLRFGVTGVSDPGGHNLALEDYAAVKDLQRAGQLDLRIRYSLCAPHAGTELADFSKILKEQPEGDAWLRFNGLGECVTWAMYNNESPDAAALAGLEEVLSWAARMRQRVTLHWNNDASAHHLLDVIDRVARRWPIGDLRWSIAHVHDARIETLARMRAMDLGWLAQNRLLFAAPSFLAAYTQARNETMPPFVSARRLGLNIGFGTDAHRVMTYNPFVALKWLIDGRTLSGQPTRGLSELPGRLAALRMYTQGSAWFSGEEGVRGRLEPGTFADLAVLSQDVMSAPLDELARTHSLLTMVGGKIVHAEGPFEGLRQEPGKSSRQRPRSIATSRDKLR
ncbi:MAG: amidohydrolase [Beijerinckiaceae bacterium]|nr:amidohydrolase [Beijerinckiaceae bacterium]